MNNNNVEKQLTVQKRINAALSIGLVSLAGYVGLAKPTVAEFEEISVERLNIVEKNGYNRMVLANSDKSPGAIKQGKEVFKHNSPRPGMIFYNDEGTENGGFVFRGEKVNDKVNHGLHMSFDRYNQDQTLMMQHIEMDDYMITGLTVMDRPDSAMDFDMTNRFMEAQKAGDTKTMNEIESYMVENKLLGARRAFYGTLNGDSRLQLNDADGKKRIQMVVTKDGEAKLEFLDANGKVIMRLPETAEQ
ncbi:hypothetical protein [Pseudoalteromonas sp. T1lg24]|uniref:hypothetical protein n=1 Tax=Pseudoalteromonas sp. T1lg24 TaxID=2077099 RepID=UPI000CF6CB5E|nr:hypothetical protein [Pseudoalteromonas sp. T1lg24]